MDLTYEEFLKTVPKETAEFTKQILPYLYHYVNNDNSTGPKLYKYDIKTFLITLFTLSKNENYKYILAKSGLNLSKLLELKPEENTFILKDAFEQNSSYFLMYDDKSLYSGLTPLDLLIENADKIQNDDYNYATICNVNNNMFFTSLNSFINSIKKVRNSQFNEKINDIKEEIFKDLSIDTIDYLETASKIRALIYKKLKPNSELVTISDDDIVPLSLFLALLFPNKSLPAESSLDLINRILQNEGITLNKVFESLGFSFTYTDIEKEPTNFFILKQEYQKYFNKDKEKDITTVDIVNKIFNRDITNSLAIEKLLLNLGKQVETFKDIDEYLKNQANQLEKSILTNFYKDLPKTSKDYVEYVCKAYICLKRKLNENTREVTIKDNTALVLAEDKLRENIHKTITNDNDILVLAFYLASVHFQTELNSFFTYNGITFEKVMQLLNLNINLNDIEKVKLDYKILTNKIDKYIYKGKNKNYSSNNITISLIEQNLYNRDFTASKLIHNIFEELTNQHLNNDFSFQIIEAKEKIYKIKKEEFFKDFPVKTIYFLEQASSIHKSLNLDDPNDQAVISLISSILLTNNEIQGFFNGLGLYLTEIENYIDIPNIVLGTEDFSILKDYYNKFIFEGSNKNKQNSEITIYNIAKNIFSKEFNNSIFINKFFDHFNLSHDIYNNFDQLYQDYLKKVQKNNNDDLLYKRRENIDPKNETFLIFIIKIHKKILEFNIDKNIKTIAIVLYLLYYETSLSPFLNKNGLTKEKVLAYLNLPQDFLDDIDTLEIDSNIFVDNYQNLTIDEVKDIFIGKDITFMKEMTEKLGIDFKILQTEIKTEQDYEFSLSVNEKIKLLDEKPVDPLNVYDIQSVINFGNSLGIHSKYIHDELPKLILNDAHDESISSINDTLSKVYSQKNEEKQKNFFERLFAINTKEEAEIILDPDAINELKEKITKNIQKLSEELLNYNDIRKYIESYRRKNNFYLSRILEVLEELQKETNALDPQKEEQYADFLSANSNLQIIKNKTNRFKTSSYLMQQELVKVNQAIINHFITINALEMARDDLLPLINAELAIGKGRNTENQSLKITQNIFDLFQSLLTRNAEAAEHNMQQLQSSNLSNDIIAVLNSDIETYLNGLNQAKQIEESDTQLLSNNITKQDKVKKL